MVCKKTKTFEFVNNYCEKVFIICTKDIRLSIALFRVYLSSFVLFFWHAAVFWLGLSF